MGIVANRFSDIAEHCVAGCTVLSLAKGRPRRRLVFINVSGGVQTWRKVKDGVLPSNNLWGCIELVRLGYEVAIVPALPDFYYWRRPLPHDLRWTRITRDWLGADGVVYCAHNTMFWLPLLEHLGILRTRVVGLLYAREPLDWARGYAGIIALTPAAADHARRLAPNAKVGLLAWGVDLGYLPSLSYDPKAFLVCGRTNRDDCTLSLAAAQCGHSVDVIWHDAKEDVTWPQNVRVVPGGPGWDTRLPFPVFLKQYYSGSIASLIVLRGDPLEKTACGFTGLIEAMGMARPVIVTRTGAVPGAIDVEGLGVGLFVPPGDPKALAQAMETIAQDPERAKAMGERGRRLVEEYYNIERFGRDLHAFFESL